MQTATEKKNIHNKARQTASDIHNGAHRLQGDLHTAAEHVRDAAGNVRDDLENLAYHAGIQAREFVGSTEKSVTEMAETVTAKISEKPIVSSAIMLAAGLMLGAWLSRRST